MSQHQAGYLLDAVQRHLSVFKQHLHTDEQAEGLQIQGLYEHLSTFEVSGPCNLATAEHFVHPVLAVLRNLITRGTPTVASEYIENAFSDSLRLTKLDEQGGAIRFPFAGDVNRKEDLIRALHIVDPRERSRRQYLNLASTDSSFERAFLLSMIPERHSYLAQLIQHQRTRSSISGKQNGGRVDFSLEVPYLKRHSRQNRYRKDVILRCRSRYVVETDGSRYHEQFIDDLKDEALSELPTNINHIKEGNTYSDTKLWLDNICQNPYIKRVETNYNDPEWLPRPETLLVLSPLLIARIQLVLLDYLIHRQRDWTQETHIRLAVIERDIPGAQLAVADLWQQLKALNALTASEQQLIVPTVHCHAYVSTAFEGNTLSLGELSSSINAFSPAAYDLILDVSMLRREGLFADDNAFASDRTWIIRSAHYTEQTTYNRLTCAPSIVYRPITTALANEVHEPIDEAVQHLRLFLRNLFRKTDFRDGQLPIINRALQGRSVIGLLPTGGGKSLTYQLPALLQPGISVVVDPIRSLMLDQFRGLRELGIDRCAFLNSTLQAAEKRYNQNILLTSGQLQFVFVSPERFVIEEFRHALEIAALNGYYFAYAVIDEVHCVSEWGHDFRTPYLNLGENAIQFCKTASGKSVPLFGLTATASFDVLADIERELKIPDNDGNAVVRYENTVRDEINYLIEPVSIALPPGINLKEQNIKKLVGEAKQRAARQLLEEKEHLIRYFNKPAIVDQLVADSWDDYVGSVFKDKAVGIANGDIQLALRQHQQAQRNRLLFKSLVFQEPNELTGYNYGVVVFTPHRNGSLGIRGTGFYDQQRKGVAQDANADIAAVRTGDSYGYFMGSGDDEDAKQIDEESFANLDRFTANEFSVMVATKAFGMGIDKPNVRMTIHLNLPQSIESFVQEAGRAGRDKKLSCSLILYNDDVFELKTPEGKRIDYHCDRDVLMYFHHNAFRGAMKERAAIWELRNRITYPSLTNAQRLANLLQASYPLDGIDYRVRLGTNRWANTIFIDTVDERRIGWLHLPGGRVEAFSDFVDQPTAHAMTTLVKDELIQALSTLEASKLGSWLKTRVLNEQQELGLENVLKGMKVGETAQLRVPFTNRYYSPPPAKEDGFRLNQAHLDLMKKTPEYQLIVDAKKSASTMIWVDQVVAEAISKGVKFEEFIDRLQLEDNELADQLKSTDTPCQLQQAYYRERSQNDTAKAVYRLVSIGVIDSYTIDYQNKLYTLFFTKKDDEAYFRGLQELMARYTSAQAAATTVNACKATFAKLASEGKATVLSFVLGELTTFVYDKIREKRLRGIDDMIKLCRSAMQYTGDPIRQNKLIKDEIYYYFNAKYSRKGFVEQSIDEEASLIDDRENAMPVAVTLRKYIRLVDDDRTGEFINNIKHLRGSAMRVLRSYGDESTYLILKAYALFCLAQPSSPLIEEAIKDMANGLRIWKQQEPELHEMEWLTYLRNKLAVHIAERHILMWFDEIEDLYYVTQNRTWFSLFADRKLKLA